MQRMVHRTDLMTDLQHVPFAPVRPNLTDAFVVEHYGADPITGAEHPPGRQRRTLGGDHRFHPFLRSEEHPLPLIDHQHHRALALFGVGAHMRSAGPVGHLPVHGADVVTRSIVSQFFEVQTAATQSRRVLSRQHAVQRLTRQKTEAAGLMLELHQRLQIDVDALIHPASGDGDLPEDFIHHVIRAHAIGDRVVAEQQSMPEYRVRD